jgi:diaminobutyrate acetyltransferase
VIIRPPEVADGGSIWRMAHAAGKLDANTSYMYVLWARDFTTSSRVALDDDGTPLGFVIGYLRPDAPDTLFVWQVAVDVAARGRRIAAALLDDLLATLVPRGVRWLEATVTADNAASLALFEGTARRHGVPCATSPLFDEAHFPDEHDAEQLLCLGPFVASDTPGR